ncbi:MAG: lipid-binding SYLF domain-containing protein [Synergistaceae bacterium]|nr:lipid-binding SYLF domain-containing protein [Synergistaceae bacterium]
MKKFLALSLLLVFVLSSPVMAAYQSPADIINDSLSMLHEAGKLGDAKDMAKTLKTSYAIALVPSMLKAGFVFGGEYGEGLILQRKNGKWYGPSFYNISGGSFGFQLGMQQVSLLMAVINKKGVDAFLHSRTKLGGDVGIAVGPVGRRAEAATDARARASIYSYSISKGLFAGVSLEGSVISISVKRNKEYWGKKIAAVDALNIPATDKRIQPLIKALDELISMAK